MLSRLMTRKEQFLLLFFSIAICIGAAVMYFRSGHSQASENAESNPAPHDIPVAVRNNAQPPPAVPKAPEPVPAQPAAAADSPPVTSEDTPKKMLVAAIAGAVERPGMYRFYGNARVNDLIMMAGGASEGADLADLNLAAPLIDGSTLTVPVARQTVAENGKLVARGGQSAANLNPPEYTISGWRAISKQAAHVQVDGTVKVDATVQAAAQPADGLIDLNTASQDMLESLPGIGPHLAGQIISYRTQNPFKTVNDLQNVQGIGPKRMETVRPHVKVTGGT